MSRPSKRLRAMSFGWLRNRDERLEIGDEGLKTNAKVMSITAEAVIIYQKLIYGDVQGENITNHSKAATPILI